MIALPNGILVHPGHWTYEMIAEDHLWEHVSHLFVREIRNFPTPYILLTIPAVSVDYYKVRETLLGLLMELYDGVHQSEQTAAVA